MFRYRIPSERRLRRLRLGRVAAVGGVLIVGKICCFEPCLFSHTNTRNQALRRGRHSVQCTVQLYTKSVFTCRRQCHRSRRAASRRRVQSVVCTTELKYRLSALNVLGTLKAPGGEPVIYSESTLLISQRNHRRRLMS